MPWLVQCHLRASITDTTTHHISSRSPQAPDHLSHKRRCQFLTRRSRPRHRTCRCDHCSTNNISLSSPRPRTCRITTQPTLHSLCTLCTTSRRRIHGRQDTCKVIIPQFPGRQTWERPAWLRHMATCITRRGPRKSTRCQITLTKPCPQLCGRHFSTMRLGESCSLQLLLSTVPARASRR